MDGSILHYPDTTCCFHIKPLFMSRMVSNSPSELSKAEAMKLDDHADVRGPVVELQPETDPRQQYSSGPGNV